MKYHNVGLGSCGFVILYHYNNKTSSSMVRLIRTVKESNMSVKDMTVVLQGQRFKDAVTKQSMVRLTMKNFGS